MTQITQEEKNALQQRIYEAELYKKDLEYELFAQKAFIEKALDTKIARMRIDHQTKLEQLQKQLGQVELELKSLHSIQ